MPLPRHIRTLMSAALALTVVSAAACGTLAAQEAPSSPPDDSAAKQEILNSQAWADAVHEFHEWLSVQIVYPVDQVPQLKATLQARVDKMSAAQLQEFLEDLQSKLAILTSPEAREARSWAKERMEVLTDAKAAEFRRSLPDVLNMTALQVQQTLEDLTKKRAANVERYKAFEKFRDQQVAAGRARLAAEDRARAAADRSSGAASYHPGYGGGSYAPKTFHRYPGFGTGWGSWRGGYGW